MAIGMLGATNANASYMSKCNTLIEAEANCKASGRACIAQTTAIVEQCKCHAFKQGEWKLVTAAVGKDGVCAPPQDPSPPPPPPPKPKPVITYGGVRGPGQHAPNHKPDPAVKPGPNKGDPKPETDPKNKKGGH